MNARWLNYALDDAIAVARLYKHHGVADDVERIRDHYRKLAEREKALTEAMKSMLREFGNEAIQRMPMTHDERSAIQRARAALALHKEDA